MPIRVLNQAEKPPFCAANDCGLRVQRVVVRVRQLDPGEVVACADEAAAVEEDAVLPGVLVRVDRRPEHEGDVVEAEEAGELLVLVDA